MNRVQRLFHGDAATRLSSAGQVIAILLTLTIMLGCAFAVCLPGVSAAILRPTIDEATTDGSHFVIRGHVLMPDGTPAKDCRIRIESDEASSAGVIANVEEGKVEIRVPAEASIAPVFTVATGDELFISRIYYETRQLRDAASTEQIFRLKPARVIQVNVISSGQPVPNATVEASPFRGSRATTDANGTAKLNLPSDTVLHLISAWTDKKLAGGVMVDRVPTLSRDATSFDIHIHPPKDVAVRVVDETESPVSGFALRLFEICGEHYQYTVGEAPHSLQTTNASGVCYVPVAEYPDKGGNSDHYVRLSENSPWIQTGEMTEDGDGFLLTVKQKPKRTTITGKVAGQKKIPEGLLIVAKSLVTTENRLDIVTARTNSAGEFSLNVLPGESYVLVVDDPTYISRFWDGQLANSDGSIRNAPQVDLIDGVDLVVRVGDVPATPRQGDTTPQQSASRDLLLHFSSNHIWQFTDAQGEIHKLPANRRFYEQLPPGEVLRIRVPPGELEVRLYDGDAESEHMFDIPDVPTFEIDLTKQDQRRRTVQGRLLFPDNADSPPGGGEIRMIALDGEGGRNHWTGTAKEDGTFDVDVHHQRVAILAWSADRRFFGCEIVDAPRQDVPVRLQRMMPLKGRVLGNDDAPLEGVEIVLTAGKADRRNVLDRNGDGPEFRTAVGSASTDANGYFQLPQIPVEMHLFLNATLPNHSGNETTLSTELWLEPDEIRDSLQLRTGKSLPDLPRLSISDRVRQWEADARLFGASTLIIVPGEGSLADPFISNYLLDDSNIKIPGVQAGAIIGAFLSRKISVQNDPEALEYLKSNGWSVPPKDSLMLVVLRDGKDVGRTTLDLAEQDTAIQAALEFLKKTKHETDAEQEFQKALEDAKKTDRRVWIVTGGTGCYPCLILSRWMESQKETLARDYVVLHVDGVRDKNGHELIERLNIPNQTMPSHAILDSDGSVLIDSLGPLGNIGFPGGSFEGTRHLRKMLERTKQRIGKAELDQLIRSLPQE